ncbi:hypothetical protein LCGC14_1851070 [marine sediment metagenome]|uniref:Uncharacterized protein n=1 Tax=marine sediment metagenome TaxID=412755 RepID=A0A0F9J9N5_9ZZZZ
MSELREQLADQEHERWSRWMRYLFTLCLPGRNGDLIIPVQSVKHWQGQIDTPYAELSEKEKDSDRKEADNTLQLVETKLTQHKAVVEAARGWRKMKQLTEDDDPENLWHWEAELMESLTALEDGE